MKAPSARTDGPLAATPAHGEGAGVVDYPTAPS